MIGKKERTESSELIVEVLELCRKEGRERRVDEEELFHKMTHWNEEASRRRTCVRLDEAAT